MAQREYLSVQDLKAIRQLKDMPKPKFSDKSDRHPSSENDNKDSLEISSNHLSPEKQDSLQQIDQIGERYKKERALDCL